MTGLVFVIDNLGHGCCHATCHCPTSVYNRTFGIIGISLTPLGGEKIVLLSASGDILAGCRGIGRNGLHAFLIFREKPFQLRRNVFFGECSLVGITQYFAGTAIAGYDYESVAVFRIEDVIGCVVCDLESVPVICTAFGARFGPEPELKNSKAIDFASPGLMGCA